MNAAASYAVSRFEVPHYVGAINPSVIFVAKSIIQIPTRSWFAGFLCFLLRAQAKGDCRRGSFEMPIRCAPGFVSWIYTMDSDQAQHPYIAWSDCAFRDYIDIFHSREQFCREDLER
jgi:hypothetical protein